MITPDYWNARIWHNGRVRVVMTIKPLVKYLGEAVDKHRVGHGYAETGHISTAHARLHSETKIPWGDNSCIYCANMNRRNEAGSRMRHPAGKRLGNNNG
jgi:hypothetical protein